MLTTAEQMQIEQIDEALKGVLTPTEKSNLEQEKIKILEGSLHGGSRRKTRRRKSKMRKTSKRMKRR